MERLTKERDHAEAKRILWSKAQSEALRNQEAEIERLTAEVKRQEQEKWHAVNENDAALAEIERLEAYIKKSSETWQRMIEKVRQDWAAENTERTNKLMEAEESARLWKISRENNVVTAQIGKRADKAEARAAELDDAIGNALDVLTGNCAPSVAGDKDVVEDILTAVLQKQSDEREARKNG
jgi:putative sterol carrier protein